MRDLQATGDAAGEGGLGPYVSFLYFLFCIPENLGDLTNIPNSIFCKFSILEHSCAAQRGVCVLICKYVAVCTVCVCARACVSVLWNWSHAGRLFSSLGFGSFGFSQVQPEQGACPFGVHYRMFIQIK